MMLNYHMFIHWYNYLATLRVVQSEDRTGLAESVTGGTVDILDIWENLLISDRRDIILGIRDTLDIWEQTLGPVMVVELI